MSFVAFNVPGRAIPKGGGMARFIGDGKVIRPARGDAARAWESVVKLYARQAAAQARLKAPTNRTVKVRLEFTFETPKSHSGPRPKKYKGWCWPPRDPTQAIGDIDKLSRAMLDGLAGSIYQNDFQVCQLLATKHYGDVESVAVVVEWSED